MPWRTARLPCAGTELLLKAEQTCFLPAGDKETGLKVEGAARCL